MKSTSVRILIVAVVVSLIGTSASAGVPSQLARAAAEQAGRWLGREAEHEAVATMTRRIERLALKHGEEVLLAARKGGPEAIELIEAAGARGQVAARLLARHGPEAARIVRDPALLDLVARHGDEIAPALIRHPALAGPLTESFGSSGARALAALGPRNARRLAILAEDGTLAKLGRTEELLAVIERYGDRALDFLWRHKGALAVGTVLVAFLSDPEPFLDGTRQLVAGAADVAVRPMAAVPTALAHEVTRQTNWPLVVASGLGVLTALAWWRTRARRRHLT